MALTLSFMHTRMHKNTQRSGIHLTTISTTPVLIQSDTLALGIHVSSSLSLICFFFLSGRYQEENHERRRPDQSKQKATEGHSKGRLCSTESLKREKGQKMVVGGRLISKTNSSIRQEMKARSRCNSSFCDSHRAINTTQMGPCAYVHSYEKNLQIVHQLSTSFHV